MTIGGERFATTARFFSAPPDFAPDRRPFLSLADDLTDRDLPLPAVDDALTTQEIADLFQRVFETLSLLNLDANRAWAINDNALTSSLPGKSPNLPYIDRDTMTARDRPYADKVPDLISKPVAHDRLPYSSVAAEVHGSLTDVEALTDFLRTFGVRVEQLLRPPYGAVSELSQPPASDPNPRFRDARIERDRLHDMRMPPYMRDSDATALSLTRRQYKHIMALVDRLRVPETTAVTRAAVAPTPPAITPVRQHVERVVARRVQPKPE